jgi:hypothetical protein
MAITTTELQKLSASNPPEWRPRLRAMREAKARFDQLRGSLELNIEPERNILSLNAQLDCIEALAASSGIELPSLQQLNSKPAPAPAAARQPAAPPTAPVAAAAAFTAPPAPLKPRTKELHGLARATAAFTAQAASIFSGKSAAGEPPNVASSGQVTSTAMLAKICATVYANRPQPAASLPETARRKELAKIVYQARGEFPGCETDFAQFASQNVWRVELVGMARAEAAFNQQRINKILAGKIVL